MSIIARRNLMAGSVAKRYSLYHSKNDLSQARFIGQQVFSASNQTMSCWFKKLDANGGGLIIGNQSSSGSRTNGWSLAFGGYIYSSSLLMVVFDGIAWKQLYNVGSISGWHHLAAATAGEAIKAYLDGVLVGSATSKTQDANGFVFCGNIGNADKRGFAGWICRPCWWGRTLSDEEIMDDYERGYSDPDNDSLMCYCKLDSDTEIVDSVNGYRFEFEGELVKENPWT